MNESAFRQNGSTLQLTKIERNSSGTYRCTAENTYSIGNRGTHSQDMVVNVLCRGDCISFLNFNKCPSNIIDNNKKICSLIKNH